MPIATTEPSRYEYLAFVGVSGCPVRDASALRSWIAIILACAGCKQRHRPDAPKGLPATPKIHHGPNRRGAFDLASADSGALLLVADPEHGGLSLTSFDRSGAELKTQPLFDATASRTPSERTEIDEVVAATLDERLAAFWLEHRERAGQLRAITRPLSTGTNAAVSVIGDTSPPFAAPRGNLALGTSDGRFFALTRAMKNHVRRSGTARLHRLFVLSFRLGWDPPDGVTAFGARALHPKFRDLCAVRSALVLRGVLA